MTKTITNTMMRNKLKQITSDGYNGASGIEATTGKTKIVHSSGKVTYVDSGSSSSVNQSSVTTISTKKFNRFKSNSEIVLNDNTTATILNIIPNFSWNCTSTADSETKLMNISKTLTATLLTIDGKQYCIGFSGGYCDELEFKLKCSNNEIRMNNKYININADTVVINGLNYEANVQSSNTSKDTDTEEESST